MSLAASDLPDDIEALKAMLLSAREEISRLALEEGAHIGRDDIADELAWLFVDLPEAEADMLRHDGC